MKLSELQREFLNDHRVLISGLKGVIEALEGGDTPRAVEMAGELDREAGAHMAFEEEVFYPQLAEVYGQDFVDGLVSEHEAGHRAIKTLLSGDEPGNLAGSERQAVLDDLHVALKHVMSCGTMLSELGSDKSDMDERQLTRLRELREQAENWSRRRYGDN